MSGETALVPTIDEAQDAPGDDGMQELVQSSTSVDDARNYALDVDVNAYFIQHIYPVLMQTRQNMISLHEEWKSVARMTTLSHDSTRRYVGRSDVYVPSYIKARGTLTSAIMQGLFPSDDNMSVTDKERPQDSGAANALATKTYLQWEFEKNAHLKSHVRQGVGERIDYGHWILKFWYDKESAGYRQGRLGRLNPLTKMNEETYHSYKKREGLRVSVRSVFDWYVYPLNINDLDEATLVFEDIDVSLGYIKERGRTKEWENVEQAKNATVVSEHQNTQSEREIEQTGSSSTQTQFEDSDIGAIRTMTEVWCNVQLPAAAYMKDEPHIPVPCKIVCTGDILLQVIRNPFWFQCHPYLADRDDPKPGNFFSKGTGKHIKGLQALVNDFTNQMNDNGTMGLNPMIIANPNTLASPITPIKPGGVWYTTDVANGIKFDRPPIEQIQYGMSLVQLYASMIADHAGAPPVLQGTKGGSTATSTQILAKNAANPLKDVIEDIETNIMDPLMFGAWILGQQYRNEEFMMQVMGDTGGWRPKSMNRGALLGDFVFHWLASSQAANAAQRAEQAIRIIQMMTPPVVQMLAQQGWTVDFQPLIKRLYEDALGYRDFDKFVKKAVAPQQLGPDGQPPPPQGGLPQGAPPDGGPAPMQSAVAQAGGADGQEQQMVDGEGDELGPLRKMVESYTGDSNQ